MAAESQDDKTEPATPKKLRDARERGEVAQSRDLSGAIVLGTGFALASTAPGVYFAQGMAARAGRLWASEWPREWTLQDYHAVLFREFVDTISSALPLIVVLVAAAVLAPLVQTGPLFSTKALAFRASKLDPIKGFGRFVEPERAFELAKSMLKLVVLLGVVGLAVPPAFDRMLELHQMEPEGGLLLLKSLAFRIWAGSLAALLVLGVADLLWVRYRHERKQRMTRQEVRDELKEQEGSPELRARRRSLQQEASRHRMILDVAQADVVVRNPTHYAVALRYAQGAMGAPTVLAKGRNRVAERILAVARENGVPTVENPPIARLLFRNAKVGREIPESLYQAVAEILAYVYRLDSQRRRQWAPTS